MSWHCVDAVQVPVVSVAASAAAETDVEDLHLGCPLTFLAGCVIHEMLHSFLTI